MIEFVLNAEDISTDQLAGSTVLDFVRYYKNLKGTKIGCREGDCGACTILVGELKGDEVRYRTMTSCLMPLANAAGKHIVTVEGINREDGSLTPVQQAMVDESGTQCGFCTVGFVMSLTGFAIDGTRKDPEMAVSSIDGNICRCTGYKSIERAAFAVTKQLAVNVDQQNGPLRHAIEKLIVPEYFSNVAERLQALSANLKLTDNERQRVFVGGGTDVYVQKADLMADTESVHLFFDERLREIRDAGEYIELGASVTVTDLLESPVMQQTFPDLFKHLKLVSSTPIRNMATLAGNFVNASPIGDMTVWFLALDAEIDLMNGAQASRGYSEDVGADVRTIYLKDLYQGYKQLAKSADEFISEIRFRKPAGDFRFNFEKVCKRTYLDIATVNTAIALEVVTVESDDVPPPPEFLRGEFEEPKYVIKSANASAGGVAPIPMYLRETSAFLNGKPVTKRTIQSAIEMLQSEIAPISDVRGTAEYKRLLLAQLFHAHFVELFSIDLQTPRS